MLFAAFSTYAIPGAALIISLGAVVVSTIQSFRSVDEKRVSNLESDLDDAREEITKLEAKASACEAKCLDLQRQVSALTTREVELMRRLITYGDGGKT